MKSTVYAILVPQGSLMGFWRPEATGGLLFVAVSSSPCLNLGVQGSREILLWTDCLESVVPMWCSDRIFLARILRSHASAQLVLFVLGGWIELVYVLLSKHSTPKALLDLMYSVHKLLLINLTHHNPFFAFVFYLFPIISTVFKISDLFKGLGLSLELRLRDRKRLELVVFYLLALQFCIWNSVRSSGHLHSKQKLAAWSQFIVAIASDS